MNKIVGSIFRKRRGMAINQMVVIIFILLVTIAVFFLMRNVLCRLELLVCS